MGCLPIELAFLSFPQLENIPNGPSSRAPLYRPEGILCLCPSFLLGRTTLLRIVQLLVIVVLALSKLVQALPTGLLRVLLKSYFCLRSRT